MGLIAGLVLVAFAALYVGVSHEQSKLRQLAGASLPKGRPLSSR
jgi:hypothetical protein